MSETIYLFADVTGLGKVRTWRKTKIDKKVVGKLTKHLGPLQGATTVADALKQVTELAGLGTVVVNERAGTVTIRAVMSDHQQHDIAAPLIGALRLAGAHGGVGTMYLVDGVDVPTFGHVLEVGPSQPLVRALTKKELAAAAKLAGRAECAELEEAELNAIASTADATQLVPVAAAPKPFVGEPPALEEVDEAEREAWLAAWSMVAEASDAEIVRAIAAESAWVAPEGWVATELAELAAFCSKDERLGFLGNTHWDLVAGNLHVCFRLVAWLDLARGVSVLAGAREAGVWPGWLAHAMRALFESGDAPAAEEAWAIFEASAERKDCDSNHWYHRAEGPYGISRSGVSTAELVKRLEAALAKKTQRAAQQRILGYCLALAYRADDDVAHAAIGRAVAVVPEKAKAGLTTYARRNGWRG